jgi:hypothetical protein
LQVLNPGLLPREPRRYRLVPHLLRPDHWVALS